MRYALRRLPGLLRPTVDVYEPEPGSLTMLRGLPVTVREGTVLRVNVVLPAGTGPFPVLLSAHPYGKDNLPRRGRTRYRVSVQYRMLRQPERVRFSSLTGWEAPDPAWWAARGYAVANCDLRGAGSSEGTASLLSDQEGEDVYDLIEWAGAQPWSTGAVGMLGVSYLAISQWKAAALHPPSLKAICPWEGFTDAYRDLIRPGGIREDGFIRLWSLGLRGVRQRYSIAAERRRRPLRDDWWRALVPALPEISVPALICGSFSDNNLHSRGSFRGWERVASSERFLYTHRGGKWLTFYSPEARAAQLQFFDRYLRDLDVPAQPRIRLEVRESRDVVKSVRDEVNLRGEPARNVHRALGTGAAGPAADPCHRAPRRRRSRAAEVAVVDPGRVRLGRIDFRRNITHHRRVKIRQIDASEWSERIVPVHAYAFAPSPSADMRERMEGNQRFYADDIALVAEVDGVAVAVALAVQMRQNVRGVVYPMAGIAGVGTLPQARRRGYASALVTELLGMMRERGHPVSTLYPFRPSFYERHGFAGLPQTKTAVFPLSSVAWLREAPLAGTVRWGTMEEHYDAYRALIERLLAGRHGFAVLPDSRMERDRLATNRWLATAWASDTVAGAVTYRISAYGGDLNAGDLLTASPLGRALLLGFFGSHAGQVEKVSVVVPPGETPELWGTDFAAEISANVSFPTSLAPMGRVLSVEGLNGMPVGDAHVAVEVVDDPFIAGHYELDGSSGVLDARQATGLVPGATLTAAGLSGLVYGVLDPDELPIRGFGQVSGQAAERLRTLFPRALPYLHAHF